MTTLKLPVIEDFHSGDLTTECPRQIALRRNGLFTPEMPTAMFRGLVAGESLRWLHSPKWKPGDGAAEESVHFGFDAVCAEAEQDGRMLTDAVVKNRAELFGEISKIIDAYSLRFGERFTTCELVGCEIPVRLEVETFHFASHIDLMFRDVQGLFGGGEERVHLWDWKYWAKSPTYHYVTRSRQLMLYCIASIMGEMLLPNLGWMCLEEWPECAICYLPSVKPYAKKTMVGDKTFVKGDLRPENRIIIRGAYRQDRLDDMIGGLLEIPRMMKDGHFPALPEKERCSFCCSHDWCDRYDMPKDKS